MQSELLTLCQQDGEGSPIKTTAYPESTSSEGVSHGDLCAWEYALSPPFFVGLFVYLFFVLSFSKG